MGFYSDYHLYIVVPVTCNGLEKLKDDEETQEYRESGMFLYLQYETNLMGWSFETDQQISLPEDLPEDARKVFMNLPEGYKLIHIGLYFKYISEKGLKGFVDPLVQITNNEMIFAIGNHVCKEFDEITPFEVLFQQNIAEKSEEAKEVEKNPKNGEKENNDALLCIICFEREKAVLFFPCKHVCSCKKCSSQLLSCPICKQKAQEKIDIFIS